MKTMWGLFQAFTSGSESANFIYIKTVVAKACLEYVCRHELLNMILANV